MSKATVRLPMIFWVVLVGGASFGSQSGQAQERTALQSGEKSATNSSPAGSKDTQARGQKDQTGNYSGENQKSFAAVKKSTPKRHPTVSHAKSPQKRQLRSGNTPAANNLRTETPRNALDFHRTGSTMPSQFPSRPLKHASTPVLPPTMALNGQQFRNSRYPGAHMATSGGSANSTRGTAVINGSDIKRKF